MRCSVVMATRDKSVYLNNTLKSIRDQTVPFDYELIVVDDGSTDNTVDICSVWGVDKYIRLENDHYRNPSVARNAGYRTAIGDIIIAQSDEVIHFTDNVIEEMCNQLHEDEFLIATVYNYAMSEKKRLAAYTGSSFKRPFFFLGSLWRKDLYVIGGNDEDFTLPGFDDNWFADCLTIGLGLSHRFIDNVIGHHQDHPRPPLAEPTRVMKALYNKKRYDGVFVSSGGPWTYE